MNQSTGDEKNLDIPPTCCHCGTEIEYEEKVVWYGDYISAHMYPTNCIVHLRKRIEELEKQKKGDQMVLPGVYRVGDNSDAT
jgi:hypothetical protein